ncbi:MAG: hypothetical protein EON60_05625 [Alphaproteobacteria bacterium]|nr:MAG: hypothetical protein EON60_05625 [Alphaproteobacteria bacterium]
MLMLKQLLGRIFKAQDNDNLMTPADKARRDLLAAVAKMHPFGKASESMVRGKPTFEGKPMYVLNGRLQKLAEAAGLLARNPRYLNRLRAPVRGDVLIVNQTQMLVVCGDYCANHG